MKNFLKITKSVLLVVLTTSLVSCSDDETTNRIDSIAEIASKNSNLSILVDALEKTDLVETLDETGPYTVFAPTNDAFIDFLDDNNFESLDDVPEETLRQILLNHVVNGTNLSSNLSTGYVKTLGKGSASSTNTLSLFINTASGVRLNGVSSVVGPDVIANNGVVHVVDAVIGLPTVVTHAAANPNFSILAGLLNTQGLISTLQGTASSPFTVFAPLNSAFNQATLDLYNGLESAEKTAVLTYHVVAGANVLSTGIPTGPITTFETGTFTITGTVITDEENRNTNIVLTDVQASNGIIHAVNQVLLPDLD